MIPPSHSARITCAACHAVGHSVGRCTDPAAVDYWRAAAERLRDQAQSHRVQAILADETGPATEAAYHRRAAELAMADAAKADRNRAKVERMIARAA